MNTYIRETYQQLPEISRNALRRQFSDSPKMLLLLDFLGQLRNKNFSLHEAVDFIYGGDDKTETFDVLRNRFFKLRKKLAQALESGGGSGSPAGDLQLLPLEEEYYRCRLLIQQSFLEEAQRRLQLLIEKMREQNIFELLPDAISMLIFSKIPQKITPDNIKLYNDLEEAADLQRALHQMRLYARKAHEGVTHYGYQEVRALIAKMKPVARQYAKYPRFEMYYHFTAFMLGTSSYGHDLRALGRHQKRIRELTAKYPDIPVVFYEAHARELDRFVLTSAECGYAYLRGDTEAAYKAVSECIHIVETTPGLRIRKSAGLYLNKSILETVTGRYAEALKSAETLLAMQKDEPEEHRLRAYAVMASIYSFATPKLKPADPDFLVRKVKSFLRIIQQSAPVLYNETLFNFAAFLALHGYIREACRYAALPAFAEAVKQENMLVYNAVFACFKNKTTAAQIADIRKKVDKQFGSTRDPRIATYLLRARVLLDTAAKQHA